MRTAAWQGSVLKIPGQISSAEGQWARLQKRGLDTTPAAPSRKLWPYTACAEQAVSPSLACTKHPEQASKQRTVNDGVPAAALLWGRHIEVMPSSQIPTNNSKQKRTCLN